MTKMPFLRSIFSKTLPLATDMLDVLQKLLNKVLTIIIRPVFKRARMYFLLLLH